jgi:ketosteroid isomerase-like protein
MAVEMSDEHILRTAYEAFNARDIDAAIALMHPDVNWPNAWEGGRVTGREAVAAYWRRQFEQISSTVTPERFDPGPEDTIDVIVHQVVRDAKTGKVQADTRVVHRWRLEDGLVVRMDVLEAGAP